MNWNRYCIRTTGHRTCLSKEKQQKQNNKMYMLIPRGGSWSCPTHSKQKTSIPVCLYQGYLFFVLDDMRHRRGRSFRCGANRCSAQGEQASHVRKLLFPKYEERKKFRDNRKARAWMFTLRNYLCLSNGMADSGLNSTNDNLFQIHLSGYLFCQLSIS